MPIYEYRCANDHTFEVFRSMSDDPVTECEECGAPVERVFHPVAVHYKGSGFYTTDYAKRKSSATGSDSSEKKDSGPDGKGSDAKKSGDSGKKSEAKSSD